MAMVDDIRIYRDWPVIDEAVQVPPNLETDKNTTSVDAALAEFPGSEEVRLNSFGALSRRTGLSFVRVPVDLNGTLT